MAQVNWTKWQLGMVQRIVNVENSNTCKGGGIKGKWKEEKGRCGEKLREKENRGVKEEEERKKREKHQ